MIVDPVAARECYESDLLLVGLQVIERSGVIGSGIQKSKISRFFAENYGNYFCNAKTHAAIIEATKTGHDAPFLRVLELGRLVLAKKLETFCLPHDFELLNFENRVFFSPLGDIRYKYVKGSSGDEQLLEANPNGLSFDGIHIDSASDNVTRDPLLLYDAVSKRDLSRVADHSGSAVNRVVNALHEMNRACPQALSFVTSNVYSVTCHTFDGEPFLSGSERDRAGNISLVNVLSEDANVNKLCDALIHEAMHSYLYRMEHKHSFFVSAEFSCGPKIPSMWTGRPLKPTTFVHTFFIYYALFKFWVTAEGVDQEKTCFDKGELESRLLFILGGFARFEQTRPHLGLENLLNESVHKEILQMTDDLLYDHV